LLFGDEGIIAMALLGFLSEMAWRARWRRFASSQNQEALLAANPDARVPALYLPRSIVGSQISMDTPR
jgi:hypothetical protein